MPYSKAQKIQDFLPRDQPFTRDAIRDFFLSNGEQLSEENLKVRVNRYKSKGIIINIGRGWYRLNDKKIFEPGINSTIQKLNNKLKRNFPFLNYLFWSTSWLNYFVTLQVLKNLTVVEVDSGSEDSVFRYVKELYPDQTYLTPTEPEWMKYIAEKEEAIVILSMTSESPKEINKGVKTPRLEKILVDLYCDKLWVIIFSAEMNNIYREACMHYVVNFSTLLRYADRRGKRSDIWNYIKSLNAVDAATIQLIEK